jgi:hypothetical protein
MRWWGLLWVVAMELLVFLEGPQEMAGGLGTQRSA